MVAAEVLKRQIRETVRVLCRCLRGLARGRRRDRRRVGGIESDTEFLIRSADTNVERSNEQRRLAGAALIWSQAQTRNIIIGVGLAAVVISGSPLSWVIGRSITRPLERPGAA